MKNLIILKGKKVIFSFIAIFLVTSAALAEDSTIKIGVLAKRGPEHCLEKWSLTAAYLTNKIPEKTFVIVPVGYGQIYTVVEKGEVDFILANPSFYVELESWYGVNRIATLKNKRTVGVHTTCGGVIFYSKNRQNIHHLTDLKGKSFMAVEETAFGGWRTVWRELKNAGVEPYSDFSSLSFGGTQDAVVYAVRDGKVDAGAVRTDTLERMNAEGKIKVDDFRVIHEHGGNEHFPFLHSTRMYPEWPFAKVKHTSKELAERVAVALINMPEDSPATKAAKCAGWTIPLNYQTVHECLKELRLGPYKDFGKIPIQDVEKKYWHLVLLSAALFFVMAVSTGLFIKLNRKVKSYNYQLQLEIGERKETEELLRKSEEKHRLVTENMVDCIWQMNMNLEFTYVNQAVFPFFGYTTEEWIGSKVPDHCSSEEIEKIEAIITDSLAGLPDKTTRVLETIFYHKNGEEIPCEINGKMILDDAGNPIYFQGTTRNITERKRAEEEKKKLETQLVQAQKMEAIGTLAGGIAHDFNNLLTVIIGNAQLALMDVIKDEFLRKEVEEIKKAGDKAASLTRQLLAFGRKQVTKPEVMDINEVISEMEKMFKRMIGEDIEFLTLFEHDLWKVFADSGQIDQVIMNLVVNARDAMPQGGKLTIETANVELDGNYFREHGIEGKKSGHYVMLAISDTGSGMDKETREHIFEPFFTTKEVGKGTGLGLSTVYGIVKQNNGFVWVYSEPGKGTIFKIYLPRVKGDAEPEEKEQTSVAELGGSETVLIVEDDDSLRHFAQKALQQQGYRTLVAENGEDALEVSKEYEGSIDLMITDVVMPKMGGREAADRLLSLYPQMKVIYMSGYPDNAIVHHGVLEAGLNFLDKPFTPKGLAHKVREALDAEKEPSNP